MSKSFANWLEKAGGFKGITTSEMRDQTMDAFHAGYAAAQSTWIPCAERLPEESGEYLVTLWKPDGVCRQRAVTYFEKKRDSWEPVPDWRDYPVIAWQSLPRPYRPYFAMPIDKPEPCEGKG